MSKIGFMQDLTDGIEKIVKSGAVHKEVEKEADVQNYSSVLLERLLQNADTYINLNNYDAADHVYKTITKDYPEDYRGWWGLIVCKTKGFN